MAKVGGIVKLVCGSLGAGKTYIVVKEAYEVLQKGKYNNIYSNIRGHSERCSGITKLPDDWRECEEYSLIIIDEVQYNEKFSKHFGARRDKEIVDLTMIRHRHCDIWLISPSPALLNADVRNLVNMFYHLEPVGEKTTKAYCFDKPKLNVTKAVKMHAYDEFTYTIEDKYGEMYETAADGEGSGRAFNRNMKLISFIFGIVITLLIIIGLTWYLWKKTNTGDVKQEQVQTQQAVVKKEQQLTLSDDECRKGENVDKPECVAYYDRITKNKDDVFEYDPNKPYETKAQLKYDVVVKPKFSGCAKWGNEYVAYTQQGTRLSGVSEKDCRRLIDDADRPFDYMKEETTLTQNTVTDDLGASSPVATKNEGSVAYSISHTKDSSNYYH